MKKSASLTLLSLALAAQPAFADKASNSLNVAFSNEVATLDNYKESGREGLILARLLYDGLLSKDQKTGEFVPELAEAYKILSDTQIEFKIRQGVKFHDGTTMTADDVVYTLNTVSTPEFGARYSIAVEWIDKAEKTDENTVVLTMKSPYPLALEMLAGNLPIYPQTYYESVGSEGMGKNPIGTGPYKLTAITPGVSFTFERFDDYFKGGQKSDAAIETITARVLPEVNTQYAELLSGGLDWIWRVPQDDVEHLASLPSVKIETAPIMRLEYVAMNPNVDGGKTPLADVRVRQAINYAVNRPAIREALVGGGSKLIDSACNPVQFGCETDVTTYEYDPEKAKSLLAEAGLENGFTLPYLYASVSGTNAEAIAADLAKVGINVELNQQQYASAVDVWRKGDAPFFHSNWGSYGIGDVALSVGNFFGGTGDDVVQNSEIVPLIAEANNSLDFDKRKELYSEALKIIAEEAYWLPLWTYSINSAQAADLELDVAPDEFVPFWDASWK